MPRQQRQLALLSWQTPEQGQLADAQAPAAAAAAAVWIPRQQCQLSALSAAAVAALGLAPSAEQTVGAAVGCLTVLVQLRQEHLQAAVAVAAAVELEVVRCPALTPLTALLLLQQSAAAAVSVQVLCSMQF
jgi:hypothetical protein